MTGTGATYVEAGMKGAASHRSRGGREGKCEHGWCLLVYAFGLPKGLQPYLLLALTMALL